jgi:hypothetical protein
MYFIFLGPNMASKRKNESDKGGYRRKIQTVDLEKKMSVVAGNHCINIYKVFLTYSVVARMEPCCNLRSICVHMESTLELITAQ